MLAPSRAAGKTQQGISWLWQTTPCFHSATSFVLCTASCARQQSPVEPRNLLKAVRNWPFTVSLMRFGKGGNKKSRDFLVLDMYLFDYLTPSPISEGTLCPAKELTDDAESRHGASLKGSMRSIGRRCGVDHLQYARGTGRRPRRHSPGALWRRLTYVLRPRRFHAVDEVDDGVHMGPVGCRALEIGFCAPSKLRE